MKNENNNGKKKLSINGNGHHKPANKKAIKAKSLPKRLKIKMSARQKLYRQYRLEGMNVKAAALKAGYSFKTATKNSVRLDKAVHLTDYLEMVGVTDQVIAKRLTEGLDATKVIALGAKGDSIEIDDFATRHKYLETVLKVKGSLTPAKEGDTIINNTLNLSQTVNIEGETGDIIKGFNSRLSEVFTG